MNTTYLVDTLEKWAGTLALGTALLFWEGYVFLFSYFNAYGIDAALSAVSVQQVLTTGIWSILIAVITFFAYFVVDIAIGVAFVERLFYATWSWMALNPNIQPTQNINNTLGAIVFLCGVILFLYSIYFIKQLVTLAWSRFLVHFPAVKFILTAIAALAILLLLPFLSATVFPSSIGFNSFSYNIFTFQPKITVTYSPPALKSTFIVAQSNNVPRGLSNLEINGCGNTGPCNVRVVFDRCANNSCSGEYTKIFETSEYLYLQPASTTCTVYFFEVEENIKPPDRGLDKFWSCRTVALPKSRILDVYQ